MNYKSFLINKKNARITPGVLFCLEIAIKLTSDKRLAAFGRAVDQKDGERFVLHEIDDIEKLALERRTDGGKLLAVRVDERQDKILFHRPVPVLFRIVVQGISSNGNGFPVLRVLHHLARRAGELVQQFLVGGVDAGSDDFHAILTFSPYSR